MTGADIQLENGNYGRIHNAILEALGSAPLNGSEFRCLLVLLRKTYGWNKKEDKISLTQWSKATGLPRNLVIRTLRQLIDKRIVYRIDNGNNRTATWGFNKYIEQWASTSDDMVTTETSDQVVTSSTPTSDQPVTTSSDQVVTKTSYQVVTHNKQERQTTEARYAAFEQSFEEIWGLVVPSAYVKDTIIDWSERVTLEGWRYGLKECIRSGKGQKWSYLEGILKRIERDGYTESEATAPNTLDFVMEDLP